MGINCFWFYWSFFRIWRTQLWIILFGNPPCGWKPRISKQWYWETLFLVGQLAREELGAPGYQPNFKYIWCYVLTIVKNLELRWIEASPPLHLWIEQTLYQLDSNYRHNFNHLQENTIQPSLRPSTFISPMPLSFAQAASVRSLCSRHFTHLVFVFPLLWLFLLLCFLLNLLVFFIIFLWKAP